VLRKSNRFLAVSWFKKGKLPLVQHALHYLQSIVYWLETQIWR
jgi:hypothetical protein